MSEDVPKVSKFDDAASRLKSATSGATRIALLVLFSVVAWRIAWSDFNLDLSKFDFSDLLAMILALFAMGMSVAFYFKSTDSSNQFYDNIYNFTQKTSEILGRIEERFGEQLKHLDEGYGRIQSRFEGGARSSGEIEEKVKETEGKEEKEKEKLEETNNAMKGLLEQMTERAKLEEKEKHEFYEKLRSLEAEKDMAQNRIRELEEDRNRLRHQLISMEEGVFENLPEVLRHPALLHVFRDRKMLSLFTQGAPARVIREQFRSSTSRLPNEVMERLRHDGIVDERDEITLEGVTLFRSLAKRFVST